jgi:hypothetical protein
MDLCKLIESFFFEYKLDASSTVLFCVWYYSLAGFEIDTHTYWMGAQT